MPQARLIDGKAIAAALRSEIAAEVAGIRAASGKVPGLHVVLVGDDPASRVYVASKEKLAVEVGMNSVAHRLPAETTQVELLAKHRRAQRRRRGRRHPRAAAAAEASRYRRT